MPKCIGPQCDRDAQYAGPLCIAHYKQQYAGKPLTPLRRYRKRIPAPEGFAYCNDCESMKRVSEFYRLSTGKTRPTCKTCYSRKEAA